MTQDTDTAQSQAKAQLGSIIAMMERLEHAQQLEDGEECICNSAVVFGHDDDGTFGQYHDEAAAQEAIQENQLSVLVRSGWHLMGENPSEDDAAEYEILLCANGPAVRIRGDLSYGLPDSARLEYQDWGTPWTMYLGTEDAMFNPKLLAYAQQFYFGD